MSSRVGSQFVRYGLGGGFLALLYSAVYWVLALTFGVSVLAANTIAFLINIAVGWLIHSYWSFRGHVLSVGLVTAFGRFAAINLAGFALNSFWVWLITIQLNSHAALPIVPI